MLGEPVTTILVWLQGLGPVLGPLTFSVFFIGWNVCCLPCTVIEIASGFLFSTPSAMIACVGAKQLGSCFSFFLARHMRHWLKCQPTSLPGLPSIARHPFAACCTIGVAPIPVALKNYGLGMLDARLVSFSNFFWSRLITGAPFSVMWVQLGASAGDLATALSAGKESPLPASTIVGVTMVLILASVLSQRATSSLQEDNLDAPVSARDELQLVKPKDSKLRAFNPCDNPFKIQARVG
eukprot:TRINITY_DN26842_c0_g1_i1.p1 TRINITY_DN26842_c0_g1~~TRINITY_DN26842_c0_g1_i1.p1  ORF type:complete len:238 (-),score=38.31 TRINITY_DN26842_c0_g1_i1:13-726(-)